MHIDTSKTPNPFPEWTTIPLNIKSENFWWKAVQWKTIWWKTIESPSLDAEAQYEGELVTGDLKLKWMDFEGMHCVKKARSRRCSDSPTVWNCRRASDSRRRAIEQSINCGASSCNQIVQLVINWLCCFHPSLSSVQLQSKRQSYSNNG